MTDVTCTDTENPNCAESLYLAEGDRYIDATVTVYYDLEDVEDHDDGWHSITVEYDSNGDVESIGGHDVQ